MIELSILLTCFNRKEKTVEALQTIFEAIDYYNENCDSQIKVSVFLTYYGCTDGTSDAVINKYPSKSIHIIHAEGNAYWAGGMRMAWRKAIEYNSKVVFYILINDDVRFKKDSIIELIHTHEYAVQKYGKGGIYSGFISEYGNENKIIYGAKKYVKGVFAKSINITPTGIPQECEMVNANMLMVSANVVEKIGILDDVFIHAAADLDYGMRARQANLPVLTTSCVCGFSEFDHDNSNMEFEKVKAMTFTERKAYLDKPTIKQYHDSLVFFKRYNKIKYIILGFSYYINLFFPTIYYRLYKRRGH